MMTSESFVKKTSGDVAVSLYSNTGNYSVWLDRIKICNEDTAGITATITLVSYTNDNTLGSYKLMSVAVDAGDTFIVDNLAQELKAAGTNTAGDVLQLILSADVAANEASVFFDIVKDA